MILSNCHIVKDSNEHFEGSLVIENGKIAGIESKNYKDSIDLEGRYVYPGLVNIHDHLISNWGPRPELNHIYANSHLWVKELGQTEIMIERNKYYNTGKYKFDLLKGNGLNMALIGVYKNLLSGVTTVSDHLPRQAKEYYDSLIINVLRDYCQGHSVELGNWWGGSELEDEFNKTKKGWPFIIHLGEGTDIGTKNELARLLEQGLINDKTTLIHCIALTEDDLDKVKALNTSIAWCPNSNIYLIGKTMNIKYAIEKGINIGLGTDSTMSGSSDILEELKFASGYYKKTYQEELDPKILFDMVTINPAKAFQLDKSKGSIEIGKDADLLITEKQNSDPYRNLIDLNNKEISALIFNGKIVHGTEKFKIAEYIPDNIKVAEYEYFGKRFVVGSLFDVLEDVKNTLGYEKKFHFLPIYE